MNKQDIPAVSVPNFLAAYTAVNMVPMAFLQELLFLAAYTAVNTIKVRPGAALRFLAAYTAVNHQRLWVWDVLHFLAAYTAVNVNPPFGSIIHEFLSCLHGSEPGPRR